MIGSMRGGATVPNPSVTRMTRGQHEPPLWYKGPGSRQEGAEPMPQLVDWSFRPGQPEGVLGHAIEEV